MSHVFSYAGHCFLIEIAEVTNADAPAKPEFFGWVSDPYRDIEDTPRQICSRPIEGPALPTQAEALRHAYEWIKSDWDSQQARKMDRAANKPTVVYTVRIFQGRSSQTTDFLEFTDAKLFAKAAEKITGVKKIGITNNESPQYLTLWEKD